MNRYVEISIILVMVGLFGYSLWIMNQERISEEFKGFNIEITDSDSIKFVTRDIVENYLSDDSLKIYYQNYALSDLNKIEQAVRQLQFVDSVNAYKDITGVITIEIEQSDILMRVMSESGEDYYVDYSGNLTPTVSYFVTDVMVVTISDSLLVDIKKNDKKSFKNYIFYDNLINFVKFVVNDNFWNDMIVQINLNSRHEIELSPRVGEHKIIMCHRDNLSEYREQLGKLKGFYTTILPQKGWSRYKMIDLRYDEIVVATR